MDVLHHVIDLRDHAVRGREDGIRTNHVVVIADQSREYLKLYSIRPVILANYTKYDEFRMIAKDYETQIIEKVKSMDWETGDGVISGDEMLSILTSAPQIGIIIACLWLAVIVTPRRFPNSNALAAYCGLAPSLKVSADKTTSTTKRGGNKQLHKAIAQSGSRLFCTNNEMFGKWGYQLYQQTGHWKKSANTVARKLAVALYYMQLYGQPFSYEKYNLLKENVVLDIPVDILPSLNRDFKRYVRILKENGILTTLELAERYYKCELKNFRGLGRKFFACLKDFVSNQRAYRERYNNLNHDSITFKQKDLQ